jgi:hypothetical protein
LHALKEMMKLIAVWQSREWFKQREWIEEIFGSCISEHIIDGQHQIVPDNCIVFDAFVYCYDPAYYAKFEGKNAFLVHFLDEFYQGGDYAVYKHFRGVFRNYWSDVFNPDCVMTTPVGYKDETRYVGAHRPASSREFVWSLLGECSKSSRPDAARALSRIEPHFFHSTDPVSGFTRPANKRRFDKEAYNRLLSNSMFVPCPMGNANIESYRTFEALECGAIPIVEKRLTLNYYRSLLGKEFPGMCVSNWREAKMGIAHLLENPSELDAQQRLCMEWWASYKRSHSAEIAAFIERRLRATTVAVEPIRARRARFPLWQELELVRHHSLSALLRRVERQLARLIHKQQWRVAFRPGSGPDQS